VHVCQLKYPYYHLAVLQKEKGSITFFAEINNLIMLIKKNSFLIICFFALASCKDSVWNDPHSEDSSLGSVYYSTFSERPKHLDPARSYSSGEYTFLAQIYEPPLQYDYLKRPYTLIPLTSTNIPRISFFDSDGKTTNGNSGKVAFTEYEIKIQPNIQYQPHPALATDNSGKYIYHDLDSKNFSQIFTLSDFPSTGTRELVAQDYVHQVKRMADPKTHCPISGVMSEYIVGFSELRDKLSKNESGATKIHDLRAQNISGVSVVDRYKYRIRIKGKYPQFLYWLAMPFFAPMPWEASEFYKQSILIKNNITLNWFPIGTGPFMLAENNPNLRMILQKNPNFRGELYPKHGTSQDQRKGLLRDAGKKMPFIDKAVFSLEKENIPRWNKFLQGYYDSSGISSDSFDQAIRSSGSGAEEVGLTDSMIEKGITLATSINTSIHYMGFNMLDDVIGGNSERARLLRQAISIAVDYEEYISIFLNGRGEAAQGPIPPQIFGHKAGANGINPYIYSWEKGKARRKTIDHAFQLLDKAGYKNGVDQNTGKPLILFFDAVGAGADAKSSLNWLRKQFRKLGVQLVIRSTDYNRFSEKMLEGTSQIYQWGWNADYPDPENFLFLLYGPNSKVNKQGENASNFTHPEYDQLFNQMKNMANGEERQVIIDKMINIVRHQAPWLWGFYPKSYSLNHAWLHNVNPNLMANNTLKYLRINPEKREKNIKLWNQPVVWPLFLLIAIIIISIIPAVFEYSRREKQRIT
jgi:ABC-type transport system substrate-binding protein